MSKEKTTTKAKTTRRRATKTKAKTPTAAPKPETTEKTPTKPKAKKEVGNNAELARLLELKEPRAFGEHHGNQIGLGGVLDPPTPLDVLVERLTRATGAPPVRVLAHGPAEASQVGCISGGAAPLMVQVADAGFDTFVTGETSHGSFHNAAEYGLNVIYGGHYATETLGLKALARHLEKKFGLETTFLDIPTGM